MKRVLLALVVLLAIAGTARAQEGIYDQPILNSRGQILAGVNVAVCTNLATTAASVTNNVATLTMASNPQTAGFLTGFSMTASGFTGGDTYFNTTTTITAVSSTTISFTLIHANASAATNGIVYMTGSATQACAPLATLFTDNTGNFSSPNPFTSSGIGNVTFWGAAGVYNVQFYGPTITTTVKQTAIACVPGSTTGSCGVQQNTNNVWTGTNVFGSGSVEDSLTPRTISIQDGTSGSPITNATQTTPTAALARYEGTVQSTIGYNWYGFRATALTKALTDVQSGVTGAFFNGASSTDSVGASSSRNQVALLANCTALLSTSSVSCFAGNDIASTLYTGSAVLQRIVGREIDIVLNRAGQPDTSFTGPWAVGLLVHNNSAAGSPTDGVFGVLSEGPDANDSWLHGGFFSGRNTGLTVGRANGVTPDTGLYIRNATTYGIWVGGGTAPESGFNGNQTQGNPAVGYICAENSATSGQSCSIRLRSTTAGGVTQTMDFYNDVASTVHLNFNGGFDALRVTSTGQLIAGATTGTAPIATSSTTPVANLAATPTTYNAGGTQQTNAHVVVGTCTLGTNCGVTLTGSAAYTSASSYVCAAADQTGIFAVRVNQTSGSGFTITGNGTDVIGYNCAGN